MNPINESSYDMIYLAGCAVNGIAPDRSRIKSMNLESVFEQSRSCSLSAVTYAALESARKTDEDSIEINQGGQADSLWDNEVLEEWKREKDTAIYKNVKFDLEREQVLAFLENAGIWYLPLKGIILKDFYPEPWMRQEADNDILYDSAYQKQVRRWFLEHGYEAKQYRIGIEDAYVKPPCYNFEMHTAMIGKNHSKWYEYYENVSERFIPVEGKTYAYHLSDEDFYIYCVLHGYRHYIMRGTGLRTLLDNYVYTKVKNTDLDWEYIHRELSKLDADEFEGRMRETSLKIFDDPSKFNEGLLSEDERDFLNSFLDSGTYGTYEKWIDKSLKEIDPNGDKTTGWAKFRYVLRRAFPNAEYMAAYSPVLAKHKWLIPAGYVYRFFRIYRKYPGKIRSELKIIRKIS